MREMNPKDGRIVLGSCIALYPSLVPDHRLKLSAEAASTDRNDRCNAQPFTSSSCAPCIALIGVLKIVKVKPSRACIESKKPLRWNPGFRGCPISSLPCVLFSIHETFVEGDNGWKEGNCQ